ncbi:uncharacterized protein T551_01260 [Pneumocystis jirovecii RU7]|nr:uncharacterized protein T551_01260 [Pneumocystis jirovecii RU7]KTW31187.1 hypothetical protein T551_01260 [Pneumocystis jirovecii RU7]
MSVECKSQLGFCRPLTSMVKVSLFLYNPHKGPIVFKIKTTAPRQYCVRPNSGRIEAGQEIEVLVLFQALKEEPPLDFKCRDKFLIQSIALTNKDVTDTQSLLLLFDSASKEDIHEKKIKCVFLTPEEDNTTQHTLEKSFNDNEKYSSIRSPENHNYSADSAITKPILDSNQLPFNSDASVNRTSENSVSNENLAIQLVEAKTTIKKLKDQLKETEQRYRVINKPEKQDHPFSDKMMIATGP